MKTFQVSATTESLKIEKTFVLTGRCVGAPEEEDGVAMKKMKRLTSLIKKQKEEGKVR